jgi:predicted NUDIX family NTP pyrophosphohydrolase
MPKRKPSRQNISAGLLLFRRTSRGLEVFLAHPGGPFWAQKDAGAWTIPKGLVEEGELELATAQREFEEETGIQPKGPFIELGTVTQKAGKVIYGWAFEGNAEASQVRSNVVPGKAGASGKSYPEIDRCAWYAPEEARQKLNPAQAAFVDRLLVALSQRQGGSVK